MTDFHETSYEHNAAGGHHSITSFDDQTHNMADARVNEVGVVTVNYDPEIIHPTRRSKSVQIF